MIKKVISGKEYEFGCTLRVAYNLRAVFGVDTVTDVFNSLQSVDLDKQIDILYEAYRTVTTENKMSKEEFRDMLLDNCGLFTIADLATEVVEGILYSGMTKEQKEESEKNLVELAKTNNL